MYKTIFGPVPSRRLGMSLGIDLVPHKVCSLDCIYCECGPTTKLTTNRKEYILYDKVINELQHYFSHNPEPDYITFSGSGEPTLNSRIGEILGFCKNNFAKVPVAVLTNGTLLYDKTVRNEIIDADLVLPSLDAVSANIFYQINRPSGNINIDKYINGLIDFRSEFKGEIWLEVFIIPGINNGIKELKKIKSAILKINPDKVQLNTLDRPGVIEGLRSASRAELEQVVQFWDLSITEIIAKPVYRKNIQSYRKDTETAILETIFRRPCTVQDLVMILGIKIQEVNKYIDVLEEEKMIETYRNDRGIFYRRKIKR